MQEGILLYEERMGNKGSKGEEDPIHINAKSRRQILYYPDGHFISKHGKRRIYEILDDQLNNDNLTIADIIQAYLTENVSLIQFIVPTSKDKEQVKELAVTIYDRLVQMGIDQKVLGGGDGVRIMDISKEIATSKEAVADYLGSFKTRKRRSERTPGLGPGMKC